MKELLYGTVEAIARIHDYLSSLNDTHSYNFTDGQLHFIVIGILGMLLTFMLVPLVKYLVNHKKVLTLTWLYVFIILVVITFAIEIGQGFTHTGGMQFSDIVAGILGFVVMFAVYAVVRYAIVGIWHLIHK